MIIDIDYFKAINDGFKNDADIDVLRGFVGIVSNIYYPIDLLYY
jgi:PleD family two-component response regulator